MSERDVVPVVLDQRQVAVGSLLAEGGEGRVYDIVGRPDQVYKAYRNPPPAGPLHDLVRWPRSLRQQAPVLGSRVGASSAWPLSVVVDDVGKGAGGRALGLVLPKAPRRYRLRHRDGQARLATLSYLTADPQQRSAAYGVTLPAAMSADRLGLVYALARLLEAFEWATPQISHGDLSAKNVLWSLSRGPEVFVLDCDNSERYEGDVPVDATSSGGTGLGADARRRAMTPNWDDPAIPAGSNPGPTSDRYSLALIFLRVAAAAHFPIQKRQKAGEEIALSVDVPASARRLRSLGVDAPIWELCAQGLSLTAATRPPASAWVVALREVIEEMGAMRIIDAVAVSQGAASTEQLGERRVSAATSALARVWSSVPSEVTVRPVAASIRTHPELRRAPRAVGAPSGPAAAGAVAVVPLPGASSAPSWSASRNVSGGLRRAGVGPGPAGSGLVGTGLVGSGSSGTGAGVAGGALAAGGRVVSRPVPAVPWRTQLAGALKAIGRWVLGEHRRTLRYLRTPGRRRRGVLRVPWCIGIDFVVAAVSLFLVAMVASPFLGV